MNCVSLKARAKINIALDIVKKRDDGYHELRTIMQSLSLYDNIFIKKIYNDSIIIESDRKWIPLDNRNLAYKAVNFILREFRIKQGVYIHIKKNIPVSAGLAGGSSDCAAALYGMRLLFGLRLSDGELMKIAQIFGADVPFCLARGTMLAEGIGEILTRIGPHPPVFVLLAKPTIGLSTATVFGSYLPEAVTARPDIELLIDRINNGDVYNIAKNLCNVLEPAAISVCPMIARIKSIMAESGALGQAMSGSGPTVYGYFTERQDCYKAINAIRSELPQVKDLILTRVFNAGKK